MKKTFKYMLAAFAVVTAASCAQELDDPNAIPQEDVELVPMTITVGGETKTTVGDDDKTLNWCEDDVIAVFDKTGTAREFKIAEGSCNGKTATFEGFVAAGSTDFTAVYPYSAAVSVSAEGVITATAADAQVLDGGNLADGATLSVAQFKKGDAAFTFRTAIGYLRVDVDKDDVTSIIVNGTNVAGQATFNAAGELQAVKEGKGQVTLTPAGETFAKGSYYVTLLPGTTAEDFNITLVSKSEFSAQMTAEKSVTIPRNGGFFLDSSKLTFKYIIKDAETFQKFLSKANTFAATDVAQIVNDIDLEGVTITSASSFKGTLDGGNFSIKNWTSNATPLFTNLESGAVVKGLIIDESCVITPSVNGNFGIIAPNVQASAVVEKCVNNTDISTTAAITASTRIGALVGESKGLVMDCVNNGDITITPESVAGPIYLGGVAAFINTGAETGLLRCSNSGNVTLYVNNTAQTVYVGGVASGTTAAAVTEESTMRGIIDSCTNTGNVIYTLTNGGSMEDGKGTAASGNYANVGGVVGFFMGKIINCTNGVQGDSSKGQVKLVAPTSTSNNAMSRPAIGGVAAFSLFSVADCNNYGSVSMKGGFANAGSLAQGAGVDNYVTAGGVVGQVGPLAGVEEYSILNCHNYGPVDLDVWMNSTSGTSCRFGGVVGHSLIKVDNCTNNAPLNVKSCAKEHMVGGIAGYGQMGVVNTNNKGAVTVTLRGAASGAQARVGGVMGYGAKTFNANVNDADITLTHPQTTSGIVFGGVVGYYNDNATGSQTTSGQNNGKVTLNCESTTNTVWMGGYAGYSNCPDAMSGVINNGPIYITARAESKGTAYIGGVFGNLTKSTNVKNLKNTEKGVITVNALPETYYLGGVIGRGDVKATFDNCDNSAALNITATEKTRVAHVRVGGIMGFNDAASTFKNCDNTGDIMLNTYSGIASDTGGHSYVHGITSANDGNSNITLTSNSNIGDITINSNDSGRWRIGGICGYSGGGGACTGNTVKGDITLTGKSTRDHNVGGIIGYSAKGAYTDCSYEGTITTSGSNMTGGDSGFVGGIAGRTNNANLAMVGCTVKAVINFGANTYGGLFCGDLNADARTIKLGTEEKPAKIKSGSSVNGTVVTSALEDNLMVGHRFAFTVNKVNCIQ